MKLTATAAILTLMALPVMAQDAGDPEAGKKAFNQCQTCHVVQNEAGEVLAGRNAKTGPNLYGVIGRVAGTYPDFKYGDDIVAAGQAGLVWDEAAFTEYTKNPSEFLKTYLSDNSARGMMQFRVKKEQDAHDIWAFLATLMPVPEAAPASN
jgi:cytochrome c